MVCTRTSQLRLCPEFLVLIYSSSLSNWLQNSTYFMCANLVHPTDDNRVYTPHHPALLGQVSSTLHKLKDVNNQGKGDFRRSDLTSVFMFNVQFFADGGFFVFGDLSIKAEGHFRFKFTLFKINGYVMYSSSLRLLIIYLLRNII
jgi:hypothetical protein